MHSISELYDETSYQSSNRSKYNINFDHFKLFSYSLRYNLYWADFGKPLGGISGKYLATLHVTRPVRSRDFC